MAVPFSIATSGPRKRIDSILIAIVAPLCSFSNFA